MILLQLFMSLLMAYPCREASHIFSHIFIITLASLYIPLCIN